MNDAPRTTELVPAPDPLRCCESLAGLPFRIWLDSATRPGPLARYSFLTADPVAVVRSKGPCTEVVDADALSPRQLECDALEVVRGWLASHPAAAIDGLPPFQGGAAGYLAYEWGRLLERLPLSRHDDLALPDVVIGLYDWVLAWDHETSRCWLISTGIPDAPGARRRSRAETRAALVMDLLQRHETSRDHVVPAAMPLASRGGTVPSYPVTGGFDPELSLRSCFTRDGYIEAVRRVREYVCAGDIFQANLSQRFSAPLTDSPWEYYTRLRTMNAAPFAAFLDFPDAPILSASPERFLRVGMDGRVESRPIKGTRPRGADVKADDALGRALAESEKDRAENLMIVDLMRNDLSRVCLPGTVTVPELFAVEHYATVHHLVSTIVGDLAPGMDALSLLRASFPGGSVTGAPKIRAMEIIAELEPVERGVYCGSIGYWSTTGASDTSIAIRTAVERDAHVYFGAGGGVIADSDPVQEYRETLDKARGMIDALRPRYGPPDRQL